MSGILANSASQTMLAGATSADNAVSGYIALEAIALSITPTGSSYQWAIAKPSASTARAVLSSTIDAAPTFTPDVAGFYTLTCVVDSVTTYVLRVAVAAIGEVATIDAVRLVPLQNAQVPTPATGRTIFSSSDLNDLAQKLPDGNTYALAGGSGGGSGGGLYATIAALKAITSTVLASLDDGVSLSYVAPLRSWFIWDATSTVADDTTDFLSVAVTANGSAAGRWRRLDWAHPSWREQTAWFVSTAGSNANDGASALTPVKTDAEIQRRWGQRAKLAVAVTITYAQSPAGETNYDVEVLPGGSLVVVGTPTVTKAGTVITAVQAQVRTAGAEAPWAITAPGLGASDVGKLVVITASSAPSNVGAYAAILKDETGGKLRVSPFGFSAVSTNPFTQVTPLVGDTIEIRDMAATTLSVGTIALRGSYNDPIAASPTRHCAIFDSLILNGNASSFNGSVIADGALVHYTRAALTAMVLAGGSRSTSFHSLNGGFAALNASLIVGRTNIFTRQNGFLVGGLSLLPGAQATIGADTYFQGVGVSVGRGVVTSQGGAFFDRSVSDSAVLVSSGSFWTQQGATPDWGTGNTGHGVVVSSGADYVYATKPTVNSGLGAGREAKVGGTDKLYAAIPYVEATNGASLTPLDITTDGPIDYYQRFANVAALKAITAAQLANLQDGQQVFVSSLKGRFAWEANSAVADDPTDFSSVSVTANGSANGRFRRLTWAHPSWLEQTAWFVSTTGSNENDGLTSITPIRTDAEIQRRWGVGVRPRLAVAATITYADTPASGQTNLTFELSTNGSVTIVGTPTITKPGTVLTAVQAQVRTAGAELGWAITGSGLGATEVGKIAVITNSSNPSNIGAYAAILKDETGGKVRVSPFGTFALTTTLFTQVTPLVGDTIEVRAPMQLNVGTIEARSATDDFITGTTAISYLRFNKVRLSATTDGVQFQGCVESWRVPVLYSECQYDGITLAGNAGGLGLAQHRLAGGYGGGSAGSSLALRAGCSLNAVLVGFTTGPSLGPNSAATFNVDCYFQNCVLQVARTVSLALNGCAFFDRSASDNALDVLQGGIAFNGSANPEWGTNNAGHGIIIRTGAQYIYVTKPTINSGLGVGREVQVGVTDKLYSAVPFVELTNGAAIRLYAGTDGSALEFPSYANISALKAITSARLATLTDGQRVYVTTLKAWFAWDATSSVADDTTDFLSVAVTANGASNGRFRRLVDWAHPAWREQAAWFVSTSGSNENDGLTSGTAVKTDLEIVRRWGKLPTLTVPVTITYAQAPTATTNFDVAYVDGGSLTLIGTPTVTKAGTTITAVQAQVRTAGAEAGWAITGSGLGASDVGKIAVITGGTAGNIGAYAGILKDETGGKVRVSPFGKADATGAFTQVTPVANVDVIEVRDMTTVLKVGYINVRGNSQLNGVASPVQNVVMFDSLTVDGSVGGGLNAGIIRNEGALIVYARCVLQDLVLATSATSFSKLQAICGGLVTAGAGGVDLRGNIQIRNLGVLNTFLSVSSPGVLVTFTSDCYFQNSALSVNMGCVVNSQGCAFFDRSSSDSAMVLGVATNGGPCWVRQTGAVADWGTANAGHGIRVSAGASYIYATKPTINSGLAANRETLVGGTDKLYSALPYFEATNGAALVLAA